MIRTFIVLTAVSGLTMSTALAQAPTSPSSATASPGAAATSGSDSQVIAAQSSGEWLASKLKGMTVVGSDDQKIGSVSDILLEKNGKVKALVVAMGGLLGIGAKEIAIDLSQMKEMPAANGISEHLRVSMTKDQLAQVEDFKPMSNAPTTTGAAPTGSRSPSPIGPPR